MNRSIYRWISDRGNEASFLFILGLGVILFALGFGFVILSLSIKTHPPAPYVSPMDKGLLVVGSLTSTIVGVWLIRVAGRIVGW